MKYLFRLIKVLIALVVAYKSFWLIYLEFYSYLPKYELLNNLNNANSIAAVLRDNTTGLRELYNNALEKSMIYSGVIFIFTLLILTYIQSGNIIKTFFIYSYKYLKDEHPPLKKYEDL